MFRPGLPELIIIFGVLLLLFGGKKLPSLGQALGESIKNFKKGISDDGKHTAPQQPAQIAENAATPQAQPQAPAATPAAAQPQEGVKPADGQS